MKISSVRRKRWARMMRFPSPSVAANEGLGKRISLAQRFLRTDEIFVGLIVIGVIGLLIDLGFRLLMRRACSWAN